MTAYELRLAPSEATIDRPKQPFTSGNFTVGPVGLEPTTYGLKVRSSNH